MLQADEKQIEKFIRFTCNEIWFGVNSNCQIQQFGYIPVSNSRKKYNLPE